MATKAIPVSDVFSMLGIELYELTEKLGSVELTLQESLLESSTISSAAITQLQAIDLITQTLSAISNLSLSIATIVPPHAMVDIQPAVDKILLSDLATRLKGGRDTPEPVRMFSAPSRNRFRQLSTTSDAIRVCRTADIPQRSEFNIRDAKFLVVYVAHLLKCSNLALQRDCSSNPEMCATRDKVIF